MPKPKTKPPTAGQIDPSAHRSRLNALATKARPIQIQLAEIAKEQVTLAYEIAHEAVCRAFPDATVVETPIIAQITPTQQGMNVQATIDQIKQAGIQPTRILLDPGRCIVMIAR
jgi:hypothetical protein